MELKNKKVLVTGAGGFIGSHLLEALVKRSARVKAFVRYNSKASCGNIAFLDKKIRNEINVCYGDLRELDSLTKVISDIDIVFNLAALVGIPYSYIHPHEVLMTNLIGTLNMLVAARDAGVEKFVQTSTSEVYGSPTKVPIKEMDPLRPQSPYSASKIGSDAIAMSFFYSFDLPVAIIRPFNAYGPRQSARAVIPTIISQALRGKVVRLGSLKPRRDFTYVGDIVDGFVKIAESNRCVGEIINIGSGKEVAISEVVRIVADIIGRDIRVITEEKRVRPAKSEVKRLMADNSKAREILNWYPQVALKEGLKRTIGFINENPALYNPNVYAV